MGLLLRSATLRAGSAAYSCMRNRPLFPLPYSSLASLCQLPRSHPLDRDLSARQYCQVAQNSCTFPGTKAPNFPNFLHNNNTNNMVVSMLLALTTCPAMLGTQEAIRQSQSKEKREEHRARRCNLVASCVKSSIRSREINGRQVILKNSKLYIDTGNIPDDDNSEGAESAGHPFAGYFLPYPDAPYEGLVSTITDEAPILNWIYVDKDTYEVKYGVRADAQPNLTGPFDCTRQDRRMTFEDWEGFVAVEEFPAIWALYFDREDDGLRSKLPFGTRVLEIELTRKERKKEKEKQDQATTLEQMMQQQKQQREEEERQQAQQQQEEQPVQQPQQEEQPSQQQQQQEQDGQRKQEKDAIFKVSAAEEATGSQPSISQPASNSAEDATSGHQEEDQKDYEDEDDDYLSPLEEADLAKLNIDIGAGPGSDEHEEDAPGSPTETFGAASIWSAQDEHVRTGAAGSTASHPTPATSVHGEDDTAAVEAAAADERAAPRLKYQKPYVEDEE